MKWNELLQMIDMLVHNSLWTLLSPIILALLSILLEKIVSLYRKRIVGIRTRKKIWEIGFKYYWQCTEVMIPIVAYIIVLSITVSIISNDSVERNKYAYYYLLFMLFSVLIIGRISKNKDNNCILRALVGVILLLLSEIYICILLFYNISSIKIVYLCILIATIVLYLGVELIFFYNFYKEEYSLKSILRIKDFRFSIGGLVITYIIIASYKNVTQYVYTINNIYIVLWVILCLIERFIILMNDETNIEYEICTINGIEQTRKRIVMYKKNKVRYVLENGMTKIIDKSNIICIRYMPIEYKFVREKEGHCILKDGTTFQFNTYRYFHDSWVMFTIIEGEKKMNIIYNSDMVREIGVGGRDVH